MITASVGPIWSAPAVIPTSPPSTPFINIVISRFLYNKLEKNAAPIPPAAAAKQVVTSTNEVLAGSADKTDPPLNPNHPNQSIKTPAADRGIFDPGIAIGLPLLSNFPFLAPRRYIIIKAPHPPTE